jgi:hypothetical protein
METNNIELTTHMSYTDTIKDIANKIVMMRDLLESQDIFNKIRHFEDNILLDFVRHMTDDMTTELIPSFTVKSTSIIHYNITFLNTTNNKIIEFYRLKEPKKDVYYNGIYYITPKNIKFNYNHHDYKPFFIGWYQNGNKKHEYYEKDSIYYRTTGLSLIRYHENGNKHSENYALIDDKYLSYNPTYHRVCGPAYVEYYENGTKKLEKYKINNKYYNANNPLEPTLIEYYENGNKKSECYQIDESFHRICGPAFIEYYENGNIKIEHYKVFNSYFNINGESLIQRNENGEKI